jgi:diguanylate cyclase (GGDEF)-like protein
MDIGMLVLDQVLGEQYGELNARAASHSDLAPIEQQGMGMTHADVGGILATQWRLPPLLTTPIAFHVAPERVTDPSLRKLTELVRFAGRCADVFVDAMPAPAIADVRQIGLQLYKMSEPDCDTLLDEIGTRSKEVASLFEINIGTSLEYDAILKKANEALVDITLQSQQHATALQEKASTLAQQNQQLKIQATTDGLTGLANRVTFDQFLAEHFTAAVRGRKPLALLLLDVDKFKSVNDVHGHQTGDEVLRTLGKLLSTATRTQDLAARYGGEEMVLVLPATSRSTAAAVAESIRRAIASRPVACAGITLPITASIGVACYEPDGPFKEPAHLLKAADLSVYAAKRAGRNCVRVFAAPKAKSTAA